MINQKTGKVHKAKFGAVVNGVHVVADSQKELDKKIADMQKAKKSETAKGEK